ncbi:MAG: hypothetical protein ACKVH0_11095 [Alphaproteobacteria bacterium]|jgi:hypothetical protein
MPRLSWRQRALYDDGFGQRFDRWFALGAGIGLLIVAFLPDILGIRESPIVGTLLAFLFGVYFLFAAWRAPNLVTPFSLAFLAVAGALFSFKLGRVRPLDDNDHDAEEDSNK